MDRSQPHGELRSSGTGPGKQFVAAPAVLHSPCGRLAFRLSFNRENIIGVTEIYWISLGFVLFFLLTIFDL